MFEDGSDKSSTSSRDDDNDNDDDSIESYFSDQCSQEVTK
jgi:hypothetical protein